jgi:hypothetical protein
VYTARLRFILISSSVGMLAMKKRAPASLLKLIGRPCASAFFQ